MDNHVDMYLDVKNINFTRHMRETGLSNELRKIHPSGPDEANQSLHMAMEQLMSHSLMIVSGSPKNCL